MARVLAIWEAVTDLKHRHSVQEGDLTRTLVGQAFSCLANAYLALVHDAFAGRSVSRIDLPTSRPLPGGTRDTLLGDKYMIYAALHADAAIKHGVVPEGVLAIHTIVTHEAELAEDRREREQEVLRAPNAYDFMLCAGKRPKERKPRYYSKDCQPRDWEVALALDMSLPGADLETETVLEMVPFMDLKASGSTHEGPDRVVELLILSRPGKPMLLHSRHLAPEVMLYMRNCLHARQAALSTQAPAFGSKHAGDN
ncbi:hypothetical protein BC628DRAFT_1416401 [Trametes gibbosa]|nr:hypothetical protein BC628DRAFT_1416401 [Trametes gibbosa]